MENQVKEDHIAIENEDFPDEFQCCVCLDLLYKPVVLACGHMACFWCIFKAMDFWRESHCPVCRHPYNHFPRICRFLHFLLLKLYPLAHERREKQVSEEEKESGHVSQQFEGCMSDSQPNEPFSANYPPKSYSPKGEPSSDSSQSSVPADCKTTMIESSSYEDSNVSTQKKGLVDDESPNGTHKMVVTSDLSCDICKQLLYRPVVLNCGDVYCEACIMDSGDKACKCPACQSPHPNGFPNVCLILEHFLEEQFPLQYAERKESSRQRAEDDVKAPRDSTQNQEKAAEGSVPTNIYASWWSGQGSKVHIGAGCDYCGMCPIIGERYKCKDCKEKMGFDLCGGCYNSPCKLPGRFNQQHTEDHQFEIVEPRYLDHIILGMGAVSIGEHASSNLTPLSTPGSYSTEESGSIDMQVQENLSLTSNSTDDEHEDLGESAEAHIIMHSTTEDESTDHTV